LTTVIFFLQDVFFNSLQIHGILNLVQITNHFFGVDRLPKPEIEINK
jgi:hypothetical protein